MGWAGGSTHAEALISVLKEEIDDVEVRQRIYEDMIAVWFDDDWDTEEEVRGIDPAFDAALKVVYKKYGLRNEDADDEDLSQIFED